MRLALLAALCGALVQHTSALYFYLPAGANKCFIEELPRDTICTGASSSTCSNSTGRVQD